MTKSKIKKTKLVNYLKYYILILICEVCFIEEKYNKIFNE